MIYAKLFLVALGFGVAAAGCSRELNGGASRDRPTSEIVASQRAERVVQRQELRDRMQSEGRDPEWAVKTEEALRASLATAEESLELKSLGCFRTLCEVVVTHPSAAAQEETMTKLAGSPGFELPGRAHLENADAGESMMTYIYLFRDDASVAATH